MKSALLNTSRSLIFFRLTNSASGRVLRLTMLYFLSQVKSVIDAGSYAGSVFIDLSKAFDSINHVILISKLRAVGVDGPALKLIKSYLTDRRQAVCISSSLSNFRITNKGVPQGSILGPLLFLLYINDLPNCLSQTEAFLYADDTTLLASDRSLTLLTAKLNTDLHNILAWCHLNSPKINPTKTSFMLFHSSHKTPEFLPTVILDSHVISAVDECSFLGVTLDSHLKFTKHIAHLKRKLAPGIRILIKARYYFSKPTLITLYYSFIHSHLNYCITSWGTTYPTHIAPLQHLQNQAIRILTFSSFSCCVSDILHNHRILSLHSLVKYNLCIVLFKLMNNPPPVNIFPEAILVNTNRTRFAANNNLLLPLVHTNYGKHSGYFASLSTWNSLPPNIKQSSSLALVKKNIIHISSSRLDF